MKSFIVKLTGITLVLTLVGWLVFNFLLPQFYLPAFPFLLIFFFVSTLLIHSYQLKLAKKDIGKFARNNMLITFIKLIVYSILAILYIAFDKENAVPFVVLLMLLYLIFNFVEVAEISKVSRKNS